MKLLINICAHDGIVSHYTGVGTIVKRYIEAFSNVLEAKNIEYDINLFSPEYNENSFGYSKSTHMLHGDMKNVKIFLISNGTQGKVNYGTPDNWKTLSINTAKEINYHTNLKQYDIIITVANDTPYAGMLQFINKQDNHKKIWIPHSTGRIHKVDSAIKDSEKLLGTRIEWEEQSIDFINEDPNSYVGATGNYIGRHLINEYNLNADKALFIINGEIMSRKTIYEENEEMERLFSQIKDYPQIIFAFARAEEYKNLEATMHLGKQLGIKPVVIAQSYFKGQPIIKQYEKTAKHTKTKLFVDVPFYFPQYVLNHFNKPLILLIPSKKEIVGLIVNETRKINKSNILIVANDIGGLHEQIEDGEDGVLVDLEDIKGAAKKIQQFLNEGDMKKMNLNSQIRLMGEYNFEKACEEFLEGFLGGIVC